MGQLKHAQGFKIWMLNVGDAKALVQVDRNQQLIELCFILPLMPFFNASSTNLYIQSVFFD
jgi:hypothetical protein